MKRRPGWTFVRLWRWTASSPTPLQAATLKSIRAHVMVRAAALFGRSGDKAASL
jgi:hypothetical protein